VDALSSRNGFDVIDQHARSTELIRRRFPVLGRMDKPKITAGMVPIGVRFGGAMETSELTNLQARQDARTDAMREELVAARRRADEAECELRRFKARCHPVGADVEALGITRAQCEAWLVSKGGESEQRIQAYTKRSVWDWTVGEDTWVGTDWEFPCSDIADLVNFASGMLALDHWAALAEMAAMEVS
jgi:hypothetical protein